MAAEGVRRALTAAAALCLLGASASCGGGPAAPAAEAAAAETRARPAVAGSECVRTSKGYRCRYGPMQIDPGRPTMIRAGVAAPPEPGFITSWKVSVVDEDGKRVPHHAVHVHHAVWLTPIQRDLGCPAYDGILPNYEPILGVVEELDGFRIAPGYGYLWTDWDREAPKTFRQVRPFWFLFGELMSEHRVGPVSVQLDLGYEPVRGSRRSPVRALWLGAQGCDTEGVYFTVEKGSGRGGTALRRWRYRVPRDGRIVTLIGHLHDGGKKLTLTNRTSGSRLFTSDPAYAGRGGYDVVRMENYADADGIPIRRGDLLELVAHYDSTHTWRDVMGIMGGYIAESRR